MMVAILSVAVIMLILIISIVTVILVSRRRIIDQQLKEMTYKSKLNDIALSSLRAQMNPHFIFNCLNSIKLYTEQHNTTAASEYLTKFSRLIRNMLDHARAEKNLLQTEIETLHLYLEMESMRFKDKMEYEIAVDKNVDVEFIEIPPLLIQPYVENAIWHGLMPKSSGGKVLVRISQSDADNTLLITVEDNGIGREKALVNRKISEHKSHGTQITDERIKLYNEQNGTRASVTITDLYDAGGNAAGTLVRLELFLI